MITIYTVAHIIRAIPNLRMQHNPFNMIARTSIIYFYSVTVDSVVTE